MRKCGVVPAALRQTGTGQHENKTDLQCCAPCGGFPVTRFARIIFLPAASVARINTSAVSHSS